MKRYRSTPSPAPRSGALVLALLLPLASRAPAQEDPSPGESSGETDPATANESTDSPTPPDTNGGAESTEERITPETDEPDESAAEPIAPATATRDESAAEPAAPEPDTSEVGTLPASVVEAEDAPVIDDRAPRPIQTESSSATFDTIETPGKDQDLLTVATSASMGRASAEELEARPFLRRGELLEVVPGVIVTQHSGTGKANQYFVRGFNLDHGTDFGVFVDAMPVNERTHAHGQGYADLNFIIPELVETLDYTKGPYFADLGDFTTAGSARFRLYDALPESKTSITVGEDDYFRYLFADSTETGPGVLTTAVEYTHYDGPWVLEENSERVNAFVKYYWETARDRFSVTGMLYDGEWTSTDQVPRRLIRGGAIDRLGFVDPDLGGDSQRYSLSFEWIREGEESTTDLDAYLGYYALDLFSNFTYFLDDPLDGDEFNQVDRRSFAGLSLTNTRDTRFLGREGEFTAGIQSHHDFIDEVALYDTMARRRIGTVRADGVYENNLSAFADQELVLNDWLSLNGGVRGDLFYFDVDSDDPVNSGNEWAGIVSPKFGAVLGPWQESELYFNWGGGFHSNDARGVTITRDPATGLPVDPVDPLVRQYGTEVGVRTRAIPNVTSSLSLWYLESDSELVFVGDAGTTEPGPATERYGLEFANYWNPTEWLRVDGELAISEAKFRDRSLGEYVVNAVPVAFSGGVTAGRETGPYASFRARYFSERPLTVDKSVVSRDSLAFNLKAGLRRERWDVYVELLNVFDTGANDIEYFYASRLPGEPAGGVEDIHLHPLEPRTVRAGVALHW